MKKAIAIVLALTMIFAMVPLMGAQSAHALTNKGDLTLDLSNGSKTIQATTEENHAMIFPLYAHQDEYEYEGQGDYTLYDLDNDGNWDISWSESAYPGEAGEEISIVNITKLDTCRIQGSKTFTIDADHITLLEQMGASDGYDSFYESLTIVFGESTQDDPVQGDPIQNKGRYTMDLWNGTLEYQGAQAAAVYYFLDDLYIQGDVIVRTHYLSETKKIVSFDLDDNNTDDIDAYFLLNNNGKVCYSATLQLSADNSVKESITKSLGSQALHYWSEECTTGNEWGMEYFYESMTFKTKKDEVKPAPVVKKANTLTLKAKKAKAIKAKKLKKKAQTFAISKYLTVSKAQGTVTYAKASGSKKITIAKNGKVTVKKKTKKGSYKVKVNVTAAGTAAYKKVTKAVVITIKVK